MCGILGIMGNKQVATELYDGLIVLQHRGQDAAGIMTYENHFHLKKGNGLVRDVFHTGNMLRLKGTMGIGHVRYPTAGCYDAREAQPFFVNAPFGIAMIHNGNLTNYEKLKNEVTKKNARYLNTNSDSEVLLNVFANEILSLGKSELNPELIFKAMEKVYGRINGAYAVIAMIANYGMLAFRDPNGIRPLCFGKKNGGVRNEYVFASESVASDTLGFELIDDVQPGEAVFIDMDRNIHRKQIARKKWAPCIFEQVYLARPDSFIDDISVYKARIRMGVTLGRRIKKEKLEIDSVIPVPDSARSSALSLARTIGVKYREGLVKNRYIGRTFIMPGQEIRNKSIKYKLNPIPLELRRRNVLLVDDSIVRGNTSKQIIQMVKDAGARKVYFASCAPPLINPCVYGVDMPSRKEFVANGLSEKEVAKYIGADKVFYQKAEDLLKAGKEGNPLIKNFCYACMGGKYPTGDITEETLTRADEMRCESNKKGKMSEDDRDQLSLL
ncbi:amidophosphoribosyltransferase [Pseudomonadota bacterium]